MSKGECIMVVDDDADFCGVMRSALQRRGYQVVTAQSFDEACAHAAAARPSKAIVDLRMPGRDGLEVTQALHERHPDMRIVVLTSFGSIATAVSAVKLGATNYLTKPADVDDILSAFDDKRRRAIAPRTPPVEVVEWEHIQRVLHSVNGNISEAARRLKMHRRTLQRKLSRGRPKPENAE